MQLPTIIILLQIQHSEQRIKRLQQQLHDVRQAGVGATPEGQLRANTLSFS